MWLQMYECVTNTLSIELNTAVYAKCDIRTQSTNLLSWTDAKIRRWRKNMQHKIENRQKANRCKALFKYSATSRNSRATTLHACIYINLHAQLEWNEWRSEWVSEWGVYQRENYFIHQLHKIFTPGNVYIF